MIVDIRICVMTEVAASRVIVVTCRCTTVDTLIFVVVVGGLTFVTVEMRG
jgi:hypothetical protein